MMSIKANKKADPKRLYDFIRLVRPTYLTLYRAVESALGDSEITVGERGALELLLDLGPRTVPEIAHFLDLHRQPVQRTIDRLLHVKLVRRVPNPRSKRSPFIELTDSGRSRIRAVLTREQAEIAKAAVDVLARDLEGAISTVQALNNYFEEYNGK